MTYETPTAAPPYPGHAPPVERPRRPLGEPVICFEGIWKAFGSTSIYEGLDLTIHRGETLTIVGGSGTGKSVLAIEPEVILYDEPTTGLDPPEVKRIDQLIIDMEAQLNVTSVVVTHDMGSAFRVSDLLAMLYDRRIVWAGHKEDVESADNPVVQDFIRGNICGD